MSPISKNVWVNPKNLVSFFLEEKHFFTNLKAREINANENRVTTLTTNVFVEKKH